MTHFPADSPGGCTRWVQKLAPSTMDDYGCIDTTMGHLVFGDGYVGLPHVQHMGVSENTVYPQIDPNSYFDRENDDNPVDLVVHYFQTNPYFNMFRCETTPVRMASSCLFSSAVFTLWMKSLTNWGASSGHFCRSSTSAFWSVAAPRLWPTRIGVTTMGPTIHCSC